VNVEREREGMHKKRLRENAEKDIERKYRKRY
jgi:hypothetical protein